MDCIVITGIACGGLVVPVNMESLDSDLPLPAK